MRERDIEKHLVARVKVLGGECRKVVWQGRRGAPDRLVMLPSQFAKCLTHGGVQMREVRVPQTVWVEIKAPGVKAEAYQLREHERMRAMGQRVVVIDSIEGVDGLLS